jgi:hypothetical protein
MTIKISFAVTHVPGVPLRERTVARQRVLLGRFPVIKDPDRHGVWPTTLTAYETALREGGEDTTHILILQDDMLPCDTFAENLQAAVAAKPDVAIVLFTQTKFTADATDMGATWLTTADRAWGGAVVLPVSWAKLFIDWAERCVIHQYKHDDSRLAAWVVWTGRAPFWHTVPSLLDHVGAAESLLGHGNPNRRATYYDRNIPVLNWQGDKVFHLRNAYGTWQKQIPGWLTAEGREWLQLTVEQRQQLETKENVHGN